MGIGYYITGTDTSAGKTIASVALLHALRASGKTAVGMKPVASGCIESQDGWRNEDALALQLASDPRPPYALVNPFALPAATAPQIAAAEAGISVSLPPLISAYQTLAKLADAVIVEGVGGWMAPLADGLEQAHLAAALELPVILVVGVKLGCVSHARLSERAIAADGLRLVGWIGTELDSYMEFGHAYIDLLHRELSSPCLGVIPHDARAMAASRAAFLSLPPAA
jgi:dethiobiotin synthetase